MLRAQEAGEDPHLALLEYRNTPKKDTDSSPAQRFFNRRTRSLIPITTKMLKPNSINLERERKKLQRKKDIQTQQYDKTAKDLIALQEGDTIRMKPYNAGDKRWKKGEVTKRLDTRQYEVSVDGKSYRRNRLHLRVSNEDTAAALIDQKYPEVLKDNTTPDSEETTKMDSPIESSPNKAPSPNRTKPTLQEHQPRQIYPQTSQGPRTSGRKTHEPARYKDFI